MNPSPAPSTPPETAPSPPAVPVTLTAKAVEMVKRTREQEGMDTSWALRVAVMGGGCSGFQYALDFDREARAADHAFEVDGLRVFVDPVSARYLDGVVIDWKAPAPWLFVTGGVLGGFYVTLSTILVPRIGAAALMAFLVAGQDRRRHRRCAGGKARTEETGPAGPAGYGGAVAAPCPALRWFFRRLTDSAREANSTR